MASRVTDWWMGLTPSGKAMVVASGGTGMAIGGFLLHGATRTRQQTRTKNTGAVVWPLPLTPPDEVQEWRRGPRSFGANRSASPSGAHVHAGVDLGWPKKEGDVSRMAGHPVLSPVSGVVDKIGGWEGDNTGRIEIVSDRWGRVVLGAIDPDVLVKVGDNVRAGQHVADVGVYPNGSTMLHLEQHSGPRLRWMVGEPMPTTIMDPRKSLLARWM